VHHPARRRNNRTRQKAGQDPGVLLRLWRALRRLDPAVVQTRNLPAVDMVVPAYFSFRRRIVHGEHGRDVLEIAGPAF
jgi:hypothetical protein